MKSSEKNRKRDSQRDLSSEKLDTAIAELF